MSLDQRDTVDSIVLPDDREKHLTMVITDGNTITDPDARLKALLGKLQFYFNCVLDDVFRKKYHINHLTDVVIEVYCATAPSEKMLKIVSVNYPGKTGDTESVQVKYLRSDGVSWVLDFPKTYLKS